MQKRQPTNAGQPLLFQGRAFHSLSSSKTAKLKFKVRIQNILLIKRAHYRKRNTMGQLTMKLEDAEP